MNFIAKIILILVTAVVFNASMAVATLAPKKLADDGLETVVLLHGLGRGNSAMSSLASRLGRSGYQVKLVGYHSLNRELSQILSSISSQIDQCCLNKDKPVHFVGYSFGGLLIRSYLANNKIKNLGRVVLIGTPNTGSEFVDQHQDRWWIKLLGPAVTSLGTGKKSFPNSLALPFYPVGIIAGVRNDASNDDIIPGKDDGLVSVKSTKISGMTDFVEINADHRSMRNNKVVAKQTIEFLRHGRFYDKLDLSEKSGQHLPF